MMQPIFSTRSKPPAESYANVWKVNSASGPRTTDARHVGSIDEDPPLHRRVFWDASLAVLRDSFARQERRNVSIWSYAGSALNYLLVFKD
jgi:hypothetical protein